MSCRIGSIISINGQFPAGGNVFIGTNSAPPNSSLGNSLFIGASTVLITNRGSLFSLSVAEGKSGLLPALLTLS